MRSFFLYAVTIVVYFVNVQAGEVWLKDLISPKGWDIGYGVTLKINESPKGENVPIMERLSLDVNLGELVGVSVNKAKSKGVELDFFVKKSLGNNEARSKNNGGGGGKYMFPMLIGYKFAIVLGVMFAMLKLLAIKGIFLAKIALMISLYLLTKHKGHSEIIEVQQHDYPHHTPYHVAQNPGPAFYGTYNGGYAGDQYSQYAQPSNVYQDVAYAPSAGGSTAGGEESQTVYSETNPEDANNINIIPVSLGRNGKEVERRRDAYFKKRKGVNASTIKS